MSELQLVNQYIRANYRKKFGNQTNIARFLGISRVTLWRKLAGRAGWTIDELLQLDSKFDGAVLDILNNN